MTTTLARYVYVYLEGEARVLAICEFEVYGHKGRHAGFINNNLDDKQSLHHNDTKHMSVLNKTHTESIVFKRLSNS